jgi:putative phosphoribosyl transferase
LTSVRGEQVPGGGAGPVGGWLPARRPAGVVVYAHGDAGGVAADDWFVVDVMLAHRLSTLLVEFAGDGGLDRDEPGGPIVDALDGLFERPETAPLPVGLLATGSGAAAALRAATQRPARVGAVVSQGGRPDLAAPRLAAVQAPTLLIVGGLDLEAQVHARAAMALLRCNKRLEVVPGAGPRFGEPGAREAAAHLAGAWLANHLDDGRMR